MSCDGSHLAIACFVYDSAAFTTATSDEFGYWTGVVPFILKVVVRCQEANEEEVDSKNTMQLVLFCFRTDRRDVHARATWKQISTAEDTTTTSSSLSEFKRSP